METLGHLLATSKLKFYKVKQHSKRKLFGGWELNISQVEFFWDTLVLISTGQKQSGEQGEWPSGMYGKEEGNNLMQCIVCKKWHIRDVQESRDSC